MWENLYVLQGCCFLPWIGFPQAQNVAKHLTREGCYQYHCSKQKGLAGCWECDDAPCDMDVFSKDNNIRYRAFVRFAKYEGVEELGSAFFRT